MLTQMGAQITWREPNSFSQARSGPNSRRDLAAEPAHDDPGLQVADTPSPSSVLHLSCPLWLVVKNVQAIGNGKEKANHSRKCVGYIIRRKRCR